MLIIKPQRKEELEKLLGGAVSESTVGWAAEEEGRFMGCIAVTLGQQPVITRLICDEDWLYDGLVKTVADFLKNCAHCEYTELLGAPSVADMLLTLRYFERDKNGVCRATLAAVTGECAK